MNRYDAVIVRETCAAIGLYNHDASNPARFEDAQAAIGTHERLVKLWAGHPRICHISACLEMNEKIARAEDALRAMSVL